MRYNISLSGTTLVAAATYDAQGRESTETRNHVATTFGYDPVSRLASLADDLPGTAGDVTATFAYNPASQVTSRTRSNNLYAFTGYVTVSRTYVANGLNQYSTAGSATFGYDSNGNLVSDGTSGFTYDAENRLVATASGATLTYDPMGRLYAVTSGGATESYAYAGDQRIGEYGTTGTMTARYVFGAGEDNPLIWYDGSATTAPRALQGDAQGSIVSVVDASGTILAYNSYDEYGIPGIGNLGRFQYTGQVWLPQVGLYYYKARIYSPTLGRFLQTDPIGYKDQNDLYAYAGNDPVDGSDPTGLETDTTHSGPDCAGATGSISCHGSASQGGGGIWSSKGAANQSTPPSGGTAPGSGSRRAGDGNGDEVQPSISLSGAVIAPGAGASASVNLGVSIGPWDGDSTIFVQAQGAAGFGGGAFLGGGPGGNVGYGPRPDRGFSGAITRHREFDAGIPALSGSLSADRSRQGRVSASGAAGGRLGSVGPGGIGSINGRAASGSLGIRVRTKTLVRTTLRVIILALLRFDIY